MAATEYHDDKLKYKHDPFSDPNQRKKSLVQSPMGMEGTHHFHPEKNLVPHGDGHHVNDHKHTGFFSGSTAMSIMRSRSKSVDESSDPGSPPVGSPIGVRMPVIPPAVTSSTSSPPATYDQNQKAFFKTFDFKS